MNFKRITTGSVNGENMLYTNKGSHDWEARRWTGRGPGHYFIDIADKSGPGRHDVPVVVVSGHNSDVVVSIQDVNAHGFQLLTRNTKGEHVDCEFHFIAVTF